MMHSMVLKRSHINVKVQDIGSLKMNHYDIIAEIKKSGYTLTKISKETGTTPTAVSQVVQGNMTSYNIASFIAIVTGIPIDELWPDGNYVTRGVRHRFAGHPVPTRENRV